MKNKEIKEEIAKREAIGQFTVGFDDLDPPMSYDEFMEYLNEYNEYPRGCGAWEPFEDDDVERVVDLIGIQKDALISILNEFEERISNNGKIS